jgi:hypothetical protein
MQLHWSAAIELPNGYELATFGYIPNKSFGFPLERGSQTSDAFLGAVEEASMRDPSMVAAVAGVLRQAHGDDLARMMLNDGFSLAVLIDALLRSSMKNRDAVRLLTEVLSSGDFIVTPNLGSTWHLKYFYDSPKSLRVLDVAVMTLHRGTIDSPDIHLRLQSQV